MFFALFMPFETSERKIDDCGIDGGWRAMIQLVTERRRQQCHDSYGTGAGSMVLLVLLRAHAIYWWTLETWQSLFFCRYTLIKIYSNP